MINSRDYIHEEQVRPTGACVDSGLALSTSDSGLLKFIKAPSLVSVGRGNRRTSCGDSVKCLPICRHGTYLSLRLGRRRLRNNGRLRRAHSRILSSASEGGSTLTFIHEDFFACVIWKRWFVGVRIGNKGGQRRRVA
jgi:hypothetical protein